MTTAKRCTRCDRPEATEAQWKGPNAHPGGCECAECESVCWGFGCEEHDWRGEALRLREIVKTVRLALGEDPDGL